MNRAVLPCEWGLNERREASEQGNRNEKILQGLRFRRWRAYGEKYYIKYCMIQTFYNALEKLFPQTSSNRPYSLTALTNLFRGWTNSSGWTCMRKGNWIKVPHHLININCYVSGNGVICICPYGRVTKHRETIPIFLTRVSWGKMGQNGPGSSLNELLPPPPPPPIS